MTRPVCGGNAGDEKPSVSAVVTVPRLLRFRDAPRYLGMDKNRFNREVRPWVTEIPIGKQGIAFDRRDLDAWVDEYKVCNGRPVAKNAPKYSPSPRDAERSRSTTTSSQLAFRRAVERAISKKR